MKMLPWSITRTDLVRNEKIREQFNVAPIADKLHLEEPGKRPKRRPKQQWLDTLHVDLKHVGAHSDQGYDRAKWVRRSGKRTPPTNGTTLKKKRRRKKIRHTTLLRHFRYVFTALQPQENDNGPGWNRNGLG
ncbi:hypothetical protein ANCDUO_10318 [Ancylostoma duodenale]|uniref:Uncharacterized protein n=1 Tax=Ancylostoma duodenale TaxID=51022 RepID=A0A0C2DAT1_9BILA|nr:hypothetical protein ANCDUO_10318 [Ancylostoma duodenale]